MSQNQFTPQPDSLGSNEKAVAQPADDTSRSGTGDAVNGSQNGAAKKPRVSSEHERSMSIEDEVDRRIMARHFALWD